MLAVGYGNYISIDRIIAITGASSKPLVRRYQRAEDCDKVIDCTAGRRMQSLIHLDDGYIVFSAYKVETLIKRLQRRGVGHGEMQEKGTAKGESF